ncbi:ABC transporter ATP-binding protein [Haloarcula sp. CBA1127]|uniref:ABC transporter ATP-binding protein n=1 Tax=Haloarcula sp. CBA1127 TaxID=1765055 RepID=UPI00073EE1EF|nr:ABC transporter ATP-binding protein [Haloarcula sp. CBA1127]
MHESLLRVENLHICFDTDRGTVDAVNGVSFTVDRGEIVGILGESGSGKSATAQSICRLESPGNIVGGSITFAGRELTTAAEATLCRLRGNSISMVFQDPTETLNPVFSVGEQIAESVRIHESGGKQRLLDFLGVSPFRDQSAWEDAHKRAIELMEQVGIPNPAASVSSFPHELSGGLRQRAVLATALASEPALLIADEPTTALDTTTQADILRRLRSLRDEQNTSILLISHDLGVIAQTCDRVVVLYDGQVMEAGPVERILTAPKHPYTRALLSCSVRNADADECGHSAPVRPQDHTGSHEGCPFADHCQHVTDACRSGPIQTTEVASDHRLACVEAPVTEAQSVSEQQERPAADGGQQHDTA